MSFNNISFILHQPQLSENIGACARAIKNFKFKKLVIIKPKPIFPNDKILATSVGAKDLITNAKKSLEAGCNLVLHCNGNFKEMCIVAKNSPKVNSFILKKTSEFYKNIS